MARRRGGLRPHAGEIRGHRQLRQFVKRSKSILAERQARTGTLAHRRRGPRVVGLLAYLAYDGQELAWPVAVVAESPDYRSAVFRSYFSQRATDGRLHLRPPILQPGLVHLADIVSTFQATLAADEVDAAVGIFSPDGISAGRSDRSTPTAAPSSCIHSSASLLAPAAASASSPAP
jgi:hypothetical protein